MCLKQENAWKFPVATFSPSSTYSLREFKNLFLEFMSCVMSCVFLYVIPLGLMADRMGSYHGAFYLAGCTVILGAAIPFILFFVKKPTARHENLGQIVNHNIQESDFPGHNSLAYVGELGANHDKGAHTDALCGDVKSGVIGMPLAGVNDTVLPCTEEGCCDGSIKSAENNNNPPLLLDADGSSGSIKPAENNNSAPLLSDAETSTSDNSSRDDELISNDTKAPETIQPNTYQVEVQINSSLASKSNVDNKQETTEQTVHDTKF